MTNYGIMKLPCKKVQRGISGATNSSYVGGITPKVTYHGPLALRNYLGHLVGHEGAGSLQSFLKRRGVGCGRAVGLARVVSIPKKLRSQKPHGCSNRARFLKIGDLDCLWQNTIQRHYGEAYSEYVSFLLSHGQTARKTLECLWKLGKAVFASRFGHRCGGRCG